jgi:hypothetical protein
MEFGVNPKPNGYPALNPSLFQNPQAFTRL